MLNNGTVAYFKIMDTDIGNAVMAYYIAKGMGYSCFFLMLQTPDTQSHELNIHKKGALVSLWSTENMQ